MEKKRREYELDLTRVGRNGDFKCPKCEVIISPDDQSGNVYSIKETKTIRNTLVGLLIQCNRCGNLIHLTGFSPENSTSEQSVRKSKAKKIHATCGPLINPLIT